MTRLDTFVRFFNGGGRGYTKVHTFYTDYVDLHRSGFKVICGMLDGEPSYFANGQITPGEVTAYLQRDLELAEEKVRHLKELLGCR